MPGTEPTPVVKVSTSFVDMLSKVTEVLAFVESVSRGSIGLIEPEPKPQTHLSVWLCGCAVRDEEGTARLWLCLYLM